MSNDDLIGTFDEVSQDNRDGTKPSTSQQDLSRLEIASSIKIPPFWAGHPELWFLRIEAQFNIRGITSDNTKYDYLISALDEDTMQIIVDALKNPPPNEKYKNIKKLLLSRSRDTEEKRLDSLLNRIQLGDLRPSDLYRQMDALASENSLVNDSLLRKLWVAKLPATIQPCLIALESTAAIDQQLEIADKIHGSTDQSPRVSSMSQDGNRELRAMINELTEKLGRLEAIGERGRSYGRPRDCDCSRHRSPSYFRSRGRTPNRTRSPSGPMAECRYHRRFGDNAKRCFPNCSRNIRNSSDFEPKN